MWETRQALSRAEWTLLGLYIQIACEKLSENPGMPSREIYVAVLEALLAVRELRTERGSGLDRYYLGNLGVPDRAPLNDRQLDPEIVPRVVAKLIDELKSTDNPTKPNFAGRNLYAALRDELLADVMALNRALDPFLPTLFRLGARGHWLQEGRPVWLRREGQPEDGCGLSANRCFDPERPPQRCSGGEAGDMRNRIEYFRSDKSFTTGSRGAEVHFLSRVPLVDSLLLGPKFAKRLAGSDCGLGERKILRGDSARAMRARD